MRNRLDLLLALFLAIPAAAQPERTSTIAGRVLNAATGAPVHRATVEIILDGHENIRGQTGTESDGRFLLRALPAGRYRITVSKPGFAPINYGARRPGAPGQIITLAANQNQSGLLIRLPSYSALSGTVEGIPSGALNAQVIAQRLHDPARLPSVRGGSVDARGEYRIYGLPPGQYRLRLQFTPPPNAATVPRGVNVNWNTPVATYYPSTLEAAQARVITVPSSAELTGFDITAQPYERAILTLRPHWPDDVIAPKPEDPQPSPMLSLYATRAGAGDTRFAPTYSLTSGDPRPLYLPLLPGRYTIGGIFDNHGTCYTTYLEVALAAGVPASSGVPLHPCPALRGRVRITGAAAFPQGLRVILTAREPIAVNLDRPNLQPDGSFVIPGVPAGHYTLTLDPMPPGSYLKSITLGSNSVLDTPLPLTTANLPPVGLVLSARGAEVAGRVEPGFATTILAAPVNRNPARYTTTGVDEKGRFQFRGLYPGAYHLYAFEDLEPGSWLDPDFAATYGLLGAAVHLDEGPSPDVVLPAIPGANSPKERR